MDKTQGTSTAKVGLVNRKNYPITIFYDGEEFQLPPRGKTKKEFVEAKLVNIDFKEVLVIR